MVLSKTERPEVIGRWINGGRKTFPTIDDLPAFVASWKKWWALLQPTSRVQKGNQKLLRLVDAEEEWEELKKGSINGVFNVVVSLGLWWMALKTGAQKNVFMGAVEDVDWVLDQMIAKLGSGKKHDRDGSDREDGRKVKR
jgi:hypothetical protein